MFTFFHDKFFSKFFYDQFKWEHVGSRVYTPSPAVPPMATGGLQNSSFWEDFSRALSVSQGHGKSQDRPKCLLTVNSQCEMWQPNSYYLVVPLGRKPIIRRITPQTSSLLGPQICHPCTPPIFSPIHSPLVRPSYLLDSFHFILPSWPTLVQCHPGLPG